MNIGIKKSSDMKQKKMKPQNEQYTHAQSSFGSMKARARIFTPHAENKYLIP